MESSGVFHAAGSGSGEGGALVFTFDYHDFTNQQQEIIDSIFKNFAETLNKRFLGLLPFLYIAGVGEKMCFQRNNSDDIDSSYFSGFEAAAAVLPEGTISTHHGETHGSDLALQSEYQWIMMQE